MRFLFLMIPILFSLFVKIECLSGLSLLFALFDSVCSWRHNRASVLTEAQYAEAKAIAIDYISRFFPNNQPNPVFVPLHPNVSNRLMELEEEVKAKRDLAPAPAPPPPPPPAAAAAAVPAPHPYPLAQAYPLGFDLDIDAGIEAEEDKEEEQHDVQWELRKWFCPASPQLAWNDPNSQPSVLWRKDEKTFPRLALLARRFLSILPTSAPSERVWSGFGHIITKQSATIDSTIASQTLYLRYNRDLVDRICRI